MPEGHVCLEQLQEDAEEVWLVREGGSHSWSEALHQQGQSALHLN